MLILERFYSINNHRLVCFILKYIRSYDDSTILFYLYRQARFGGAFELVNTPSLSERPLIYHHDITHKAQMATVISKQLDSSVDVVDNVGIVELDVGKRKFRKPKHRKPLVDRPIHRRSILAVQLYLQVLILQYVIRSYYLCLQVINSNQCLLSIYLFRSIHKFLLYIFRQPEVSLIIVHLFADNVCCVVLFVV